MKEPTYQQALSKGWEMVWHHKNLWVLGLLAAFLGQLGLGDFFGRLWMLYYKGTVSSGLETFWQNYSFSIGTMDWYNILGILWLVGLLILIIIVVIFLAVTSQGALIAYAAAWYKSSRYKNFGKAWHKSVIHFWPMFKIVIGYKIIFCLLILSGVALLKFTDASMAGWIYILSGFALGIIMFFYLVFSIVYIYAIAYVVVDNNKATEAVRKAWSLLSDHILVSLEVGLIMIFLNLLLVIAGAVALVLSLVPAMIIWVVAGLLSISALSSFGFLVAVFLWLLIVVFLVAIFNAFNTSVWTYLFIHMHKKGIVSRTVHYVSKLFRR